MSDLQENNLDKYGLTKIHDEPNQEAVQSQISEKSNKIIENEYTSLSKTFTTLDNSLKYINSSTIKFDLDEMKKVLIFRLQIDENFSSFSANELQGLKTNFKTKSIVVLFSSNSCESFMLFWKSENIDYFLVFKPPQKKTAFEIKELFGFVTCCLVNSLCDDHLGLNQECKISQDSNEISLTQIADKDGFNILKLCAEDGNLKCVEILLSLNIFKDDVNDIFNPQSRAQFLKHYDVLLLLFENNFTYPKYLFTNQFPDNLRNFIMNCENIHKAVMTKNLNLVKEIISEYPKLSHFYNTKNESVLKTALTSKQFGIYEALLAYDVIFGQHENFEKILEEFNDKELTILREIHFRCSKDLPEKHMDVLMTNTSISHDDILNEGRENLVRRAYNVLNKDPLINPILKVVAASKRFTIVFDFKRLSVNTVDPTASENMKGVFYLDRKICIGAKQLLDPITEHETFGTLAHELCHYAMFLTFRNLAKPYLKSDSQTKKEYKMIIQYCMNRREEEEIISFVYSYNSSMHSAELIVRVVHLLAMYHNQPDKINHLKDIYSSLFNYHSDVVIPAIKKALPSIRAKAEKEIMKKDKKISNLFILLFISIGLGIVVACLASLYFYKPVYKFDELSIQDKDTVRNGLVLYKNITLKLNELFPNNSAIFSNLTSDHISKLLENEKLDFNDAMFRYLEEQIHLDWKTLANALKAKFLTSDLNFQNEILKLQKFLELYPEAFDALTSHQIIQVLSGSKLKIGSKFEAENKFYVERIFIPEDAKLIVFEYEYGHEYVYDYDTLKEHVQNRTKENTLEEFYNEFLTKNFNEISELFDKVKKNPLSKPLYNDLEQDEIGFMHKNYSEIIQHAQKEKILILSSEAGAGKTTTFEKLAMKIKTKFPTRWVSYIDLPRHTELYRANTTPTNLLKEILGLNPEKNNFEVKIFEECFKSDNLVLLWNAFDEISPTYNEFILNVLKSIHETSSNVQFVCTRPFYSDQLNEIFKVRTWQLVPFDEAKKKEFLREFFIYKNVSNEKIEHHIEKVEQIVNKLNFTQNSFIYEFQTPLMLRLIAEIHENEELFESENIYGVFWAFVEKKIEIWLEKSRKTFNLAKKFIFGGELKIILQKFALLNEFKLYSFTTLGLKMRKLQILRKEMQNNFTMEEISQMGILFINGKNNFQFSHQTFCEFFVAQFFIENIFTVEDVNNDEAELRLELFYKMIIAYGDNQQIITDFMTSYLKMRPQNSKKFNPTISKLLRTKFKNFFIRLLSTNYSQFFEFLFEFFKPDHDLLVDLLHVHQPETFYTAIYNPNHFALFTYFDKIKSYAIDCLFQEEYQKFETGKNQKGINLFGSHFYDLLFKKAFRSDSEIFFWKFFDNIHNNLTKEEQKKLFVAALSPKIYLFYDKMFSTADFHEYENLWSKFEHLLEPNEMKEALGDALVFYFEICPNDKEGHEKFFKLLLEKVKKFLSNSQIFEMFLTKNILHEAHWDPPSFKELWNFLSNHTNVAERRQILLQDDLDDKNFYSWSSYNELKESFSSYQYPYFYYDFTPFKIFHRTLIAPDASTFDFTKKIYQKYFNKSEIQEIIFSSNDFLYYVIGRADEEPFKKFVTFLDELFKGNEKLLKEFLERKIEPTNLSVFEFIEDFRSLSNSRPEWFNNLKLISDLYAEMR